MEQYIKDDISDITYCPNLYLTRKVPFISRRIRVRY